MDRRMRNDKNIGTDNFDAGLTDAFSDAPLCGALGSIDDLTRRRIINDLIEEVETFERSAIAEAAMKKRGGGVFAYAAAAGFVVLLAAGGFWMTWNGSGPLAKDPDTYFGEVVDCSASLFIDNDTAPLHAPIPVGKAVQTTDGTALLRLPTGIDLWMDEHTETAIATLTDDRVILSVDRGEAWFRIDPKREGPALSVVTPQGRIEVTGTIFVVNAQPGEVLVTLLRGSVKVVLSSGEKRLSDGHAMSLRKGASYALAQEEKRSMHHRLAALTWEVDTLADAIDAPPEKGEAPLLNVDPSISATQSTPVQAPEKSDPDTLLAEIQTQRGRGNWPKVESLYKKLIRIAPGSETAVVSRVSLGDVYLSKLHRYKDALQQFERYIRSGHTTLLPEAHYGRCAALKAMGDSLSEEKCLISFVRRFSSSLQAAKAEARLNALRGERLR